jgi:2-polyprenyl-6-hydroxyphenyl methylase/3-demethylubiquinone-9 3-methyltransferase
MEVTGLDISPDVIERGKELYPDLDLRCVSEPWDEDLLCGQYDVVVASEVIEHVLHPNAFLKQIAKALKPGGRLLLTTQNSNAIHYRLRMLVGRFRWDPTHLRLYSRPELEEELKAGGFEIEKAFGIPINPKGPQKIPRLFAYYSAKCIPNFCWTWGMVARRPIDDKT